jgi:hypothetical protein
MQNICPDIDEAVAPTIIGDKVTQEYIRYSRVNAAAELKGYATEYMHDFHYVRNTKDKNDVCNQYYSKEQG